MISFVDFGEVALANYVLESEDIMRDFFSDGDGIG